MTRLLELVSGLSSIVKVGWILWLTWAVAQVYRYSAPREWDSAPEVDTRAAGWPPLRAEDVVATIPPSDNTDRREWPEAAVSAPPAPTAAPHKSSKRRRRSAAASSPTTA